MVTSRNETSFSYPDESRLENYTCPAVEVSPSFSLNANEEKSLRDLLIESSKGSQVQGRNLLLSTEMDTKPSGNSRKKRGRKPAKVDVEARLQRSRQSARECRARKKMRYRLLEELIDKKETENLELRKELEKCLKWYNIAQKGDEVPEEITQQYTKDLNQKEKEESLEEINEEDENVGTKAKEE